MISTLSGYLCVLFVLRAQCYLVGVVPSGAHCFELTCFLLFFQTSKATCVCDHAANMGHQIRMKDFFAAQAKKLATAKKAEAEGEKDTSADDVQEGSSQEEESEAGTSGQGQEDTGGHINVPADFLLSIMKQQQVLLDSLREDPPKRARSMADSDSPAPKRQDVHELSDEEEDKAEAWDDAEAKLDALGEQDSEEVEEEPGDESDMLVDLKDFFTQEEKVGTPVTQHTADALASTLRSMISGSRQAELLDKILRPANCDTLIVPRINPEVWKTMKGNTRKTDGDWRKIQSMVSKALTKIVVIFDTLKVSNVKESKGELKEAWKILAILFRTFHVSEKS